MAVIILLYNPVISSNLQRKIARIILILSRLIHAVMKQVKQLRFLLYLDLISFDTSTANYLLHYNPQIIFCFFIATISD